MPTCRCVSECFASGRLLDLSFIISTCVAVRGKHGREGKACLQLEKQLEPLALLLVRSSPMRLGEKAEHVLQNESKTATNIPPGAERNDRQTSKV
mmetsp:Transcript_15594/g.52241  ORF Transcript_15594/g.52241 Transcript_15594/m.52241 type:complete len:95 (+) Transcript_15594:3294-3578(+)